MELLTSCFDCKIVCSVAFSGVKCRMISKHKFFLQKLLVYSGYSKIKPLYHRNIAFIGRIHAFDSFDALEQNFCIKIFSLCCNSATPNPRINLGVGCEGGNVYLFPRYRSSLHPVSRALLE